MAKVLFCFLLHGFQDNRSSLLRLIQKKCEIGVVFKFVAVLSWADCVSGMEIEVSPNSQGFNQKEK
eukprot:14304757-Ditylum_brightwellii.AAC.1